ncbi:MAG: septal ring lytic transglycosylase RlpA family protein [Nitrosomonas sp.]|nr:septal ring lytic transglycosylase RlpA family protein [Nitrosomonas sp.]MDP1950264.1 septal ring lytic transglycosylase RlpA family protein [Nitrosomonas sp.]
MITLIPIVRFAVAVMLISLVGCSSTAKHGSSAGQKSSVIASTSGSGSVAKKGRGWKNGGGYYLDDGPGDNPPANIDAIPDAIPRIEPLREANMRPYVALGQTFQPMTALGTYRKRGVASWYGRRYHGNQTASGEVYDMYAMTAAHPTLPLPSFARVTNVKSGKSIIVRVNDRGPFLSNRIIDLSYTAAHKLDILSGGSGEVVVESILPGTNIHLRTNLATRSVKTPPKQPAPVTLASVKTIYLQLGAFGNADNANNFLSQMQSKLSWLGENLEIAKKEGLFKIQAGPFPNRVLAQRAADEITQKLAIKPMLLID